MLHRVTLVVDRDRQVEQILDLPLVGSTGVYYEAGHAWFVLVAEIRLLVDSYEMRFLKIRTIQANPHLRAVANGKCFRATNSYSSSDKPWSFEPASPEDAGTTSDAQPTSDTQPAHPSRKPRSRATKGKT